MRWFQLMALAAVGTLVTGCDRGGTRAMPWDDRHEPGLWRLRVVSGQGPPTTLACYAGPSGDLTIVNAGRSDDLPIPGMECEAPTVRSDGDGWVAERQCELRGRQGVYRYRITGDMARSARVEGAVVDPQSGRELARGMVQEAERLGECPSELRAGEVLVADPMRRNGPWRILQNGNAYRTVEELPDELREQLR